MPNEELREKVARACCYWADQVKNGTCLDNYCTGGCIAVEPEKQFRQMADAILTLISEDRQSLLAEIEELTKRSAIFEQSFGEAMTLAASYRDARQAAIAEAARLRAEVAGVLAPFAEAAENAEISGRRPADFIDAADFEPARALYDRLNPPAQPEEAGE